MPQTDLLKRYLDAGMAFTSMTRKRAEGIVKDLVRAGEVQRDQAQDRVDDLVKRSRKNTEQLLELVRSEIKEQLSAMGLATKDDLARLESKLAKMGAPGAATKPATTLEGPKKAPAKKVAPKKATRKAAEAPAPDTRASEASPATPPATSPPALPPSGGPDVLTTGPGAPPRSAPS